MNNHWDDDFYDDNMGHALQEAEADAYQQGLIDQIEAHMDEQEALIGRMATVLKHCEILLEDAGYEDFNDVHAPATVQRILADLRDTLLTLESR